MGGADKPALVVGKKPMVVSVARAATAAGIRRLIVIRLMCRSRPCRAIAAIRRTGLPAPLEPVTVQAAGRDGGFAPWLDCHTPARSGLGTAVLASPRSRSDRRGMTTLDNWTAAACEKLGIEVALVDIRQILDLARVAAHQIERPAAPLTAYLLGLAVGAGQPADQAAAQLAVLASDWPTA